MALVGGLRLELSDTSSLELPLESVQPPKYDFHFFDQNFQRLRPCGQGAFGEVWCCKSFKDETICAVKAVRFRGGGSIGNSIETSVMREAQVLASIDHPNIVHCVRSWIQTDSADGGDATGSTRASSWPSTPATPFAPPPSPGLRYGMPPLKLSEGTSLESSRFTYPEQSCSGVIFFELRDEDGVLSESKEAACAASPDSPASDAESETRPLPRRGRSEDGPQYGATLFLQMELCKERNLQHWISEQNSEPATCEEQRTREAKSIFLQCLRALAHLHGLKWMHRDIKPSNILFGQDDAIRLADFGLAKAVEAPSCLPSPRLAPRGMQAGTPCYASPEQLSGKDMDTSTDVFSLGIVLAELICPVQTQMERAAVLEALRGRRELGGDKEQAAMAVRMTDPVPSLRPTAAQLLLELEDTEAPMTIRSPGPGDVNENGRQSSAGSEHQDNTNSSD